MKVINTQAKVGLTTTIIAFLVGIWLFLAPLIVDYQSDWKTLADPTRNDLWTGGVLVVVSAVALLLFAAFAIRDAVRAAEGRS